MVKKTSNKLLKAPLKDQGELQKELLRVSEDAINDTASAYKNISRQIEITEELGKPNIATLESAQIETRMAIVDLVSVATDDDPDKTKKVLSGYGLDFL